MNKKYIIFNSEQSADFLSSYLFYIILISCLVCILSNYMNYYNENFSTSSTASPSKKNNSSSKKNNSSGKKNNSSGKKNNSSGKKNNSSSKKTNLSSNMTNSSSSNISNSSSSNISNSSSLKNPNLENLITENNELSDKLNNLEEKIILQNRIQYISNNFIKINDSSFPDEYKLINLYFKHLELPEIDLSTYYVISKETDFDILLKEAEKFINLYEPGDLVTTNSSFKIDKNTICYKNISDNLYIRGHPDCMVCSVNDEYLNTTGWSNTRTNINKVCLFNKDAKPNSGIPSESDCKKLCNI
jgi:hypothetical protein